VAILEVMSSVPISQGEDRPDRAGLIVAVTLAGCVVTAIFTYGLLTLVDRGVSLSPLLLAPIAPIALYWVIRVDLPESLPISLRAPLDSVALGMLSISMLFMTMNGVRAAGSLAVSDVFLLLATAAAIPAVFERRLERPFMLPAWILIPAGVIVTVGLVSMIFLGDSLVSLAGLLRLVASMVLVPFVVGEIGGPQRALPWLVDLWIASAIVNSAVAIGDFGLHLGIGERVTHVISAGRSTGLTTHSNHLGVAMCITTPLVLARLATAKSNLQRLFFFGSLCAVGMAVLTTGSRGALVAFGLAVIFGASMLPPELRRQTWRWVLIAGVAGVVVAGLAFRGQALDSLKRISGGDATVRAQVADSDKERAGARAAGLHQVTISPILGTGLVHARDAHMIYLQLAASSGLIGLGAFLSFLIGSVWSARRRARSPDLPLEVRAIITAAGASVTIWALLGLVENQVADRYLYVPTGLIIAGLWYGAGNPSLGAKKLLSSK
jgi:hypothetical protein